MSGNSSSIDIEERTFCFCSEVEAAIHAIGEEIMAETSFKPLDF